jgi:diguanylate cyclase (GGDEF)-like protein
MVLALVGTLGNIIMIFERLHAELVRQASVDPLTESLNRRSFMLRAETILSRRRADRLAVLLMDLDHFKAVNDRYGHAAGDAVLTAFANLSRQVLRDGDLFSRYGGEEFVALLTDCDAAGAEAMAERLRARLAAHAIIVNDQKITLTVSIGIAVPTRPGIPLEDLVGSADTALYRAKALGRNRVIRAQDKKQPQPAEPFLSMSA